MLVLPANTPIPFGGIASGIERSAQGWIDGPAENIEQWRENGFKIEVDAPLAIARSENITRIVVQQADLYLIQPLRDYPFLRMNVNRQEVAKHSQQQSSQTAHRQSFFRFRRPEAESQKGHLLHSSLLPET